MTRLASRLVAPERSDLADRLARRTLELVDIPSVSREEAAIAAHVAAAMPWAPAWRDPETLWYGGRPRIVLAGHLDTVPPQGNVPGRREDGVVWGLGASDMKGGVAVMVELARDLGERDDVGYLYFPREELPASENPLPALFESVPGLAGAELAILLEPTNGDLEAGCLGHLQATVVVEGRSAHSARPWQGVNAIELAFERLAPVARLEPRKVEIDGLQFVEVLSLTEIRGGIAPNVLPDRVEATISYRYAPDRTAEEAELELRRLAGDLRLELVGNSPPGRVVVRAPLVETLVRAGDLEVRGKQAWTNVADFTSRGVDAVNLGPGMTSSVHSAEERIEVSSLVRTYEALRRFLEELA
jgi:succinyl-diaminopimelate desuccinylase